MAMVAARRLLGSCLAWCSLWSPCGLPAVTVNTDGCCRHRHSLVVAGTSLAWSPATWGCPAGDCRRLRCPHVVAGTSLDWLPCDWLVLGPCRWGFTLARSVGLASPWGGFTCTPAVGLAATTRGFAFLGRSRWFHMLWLGPLCGGMTGLGWKCCTVKVHCDYLVGWSAQVVASLPSFQFGSAGSPSVGGGPLGFSC